MVLLSEILMKSASLTGQQVRSVVLSANPGGVSLEILRSLAKSFPSREEVSPLLPSSPHSSFLTSFDCDWGCFSVSCLVKLALSLVVRPVT